MISGEKIYNQEALDDLKKILSQKFPNYFDRIILFGSQVAGKRDSRYSDYDILLILKESFDWKFENQIYDICFDINLKYDIVTDVKLITQKDLNSIRGKQAYIQNALEYGLAI